MLLYLLNCVVIGPILMATIFFTQYYNCHSSIVWFKVAQLKTLIGYFAKHALQISYRIWKVVFNVDQTIVSSDKNYIKQTNIQWPSRHRLWIWIYVFLLFTMYVALLYKARVIKQDYVVAVNTRNWPGKVGHFLKYLH